MDSFLEQAMGLLCLIVKQNGAWDTVAYSMKCFSL